MLHYYKYTRPKKNDHWYPDPDHKAFQDVGCNITETLFGNDRTFICYVESDLAKINGVLNSTSELNWQKLKDIDEATQRCNDNIPHEVGQEFTNDGVEVIDNRALLLP